MCVSASPHPIPHVTGPWASCAFIPAGQGKGVAGGAQDRWLLATTFGCMVVKDVLTLKLSYGKWLWASPPCAHSSASLLVPFSGDLLWVKMAKDTHASDGSGSSSACMGRFSEGNSLRGIKTHAN